MDGRQTGEAMADKRKVRQISINLEEDTISFFKKEAQQLGIPYQTLIKLYLRDCVTSEKKLTLNWE